ncbi:MAG: PH domain-containing protein [Pseudomonadota bacterium]
MVFESKVDVWLQVLFVMSIAFCGITCFSMLRQPLGTAGWLTIGSTLAVGVAFPIWLYLSTKYTVDDHQCRVSSGPFRWVINLDDIEDIKPTTNVLSSPALSLDRLLITYADGKSLMVSPEDKKGFIAALKRKSP